MSLTRRTVLKASAGGVAALAWGGRARAQSPGAPFLLLVHCSGGWDQSMVFDPKIGVAGVTQEPDAVKGASGKLTYGDHPGRPSVKAFFDAHHDNAAIVNGLNCQSLDHRVAYYFSYGTVPPTKIRSVDWATYYAGSVNPAAPLPHVAIDAPFMPGESNDFAVQVTSTTMAEYLGKQVGDALGAASEAALTTFRANALLKAPDAAHKDSLDYQKLKALGAGFTHEGRLATALKGASDKVGDQGTDSAFLHAGKLAVELFAQGQSQAVTLQAGATDVWDTTSDNYARQTANYEMLFSGLGAVIDYAVTRGIGANLLIVAVSELGRAPLANAAGGKGPWPYTSALLWGPSINGNTICGATDDALRAKAIDPIFGTPGGGIVPTLANVFAGIYLKAGVPQKLILPDSVKPLAPILKGST